MPVKVPQITIDGGADPSVQARMLVQGGVAGVVELRPIDHFDVRASDRVVLKTFDTRSIFYAALNPATLANPDLRAAIRAALDGPGICRHVVKGAPNPDWMACQGISGPWLNSSPFNDRSIPAPVADDAAVQASMRAAGATRLGERWRIEGNPVTLRVGVDPDANAFYAGLAAQVDKQLTNAGFEVTRVPDARSNPSKMDLWVGRHVFGLSEDAEDLLRVGPLGAQTPEMNAGLDAMLVASTHGAQQDAAHDVHRVVAEQRWLLPLWREQRMSGWSKSIYGNTLTPRTYWGAVHEWEAGVAAMPR